MRILLRKLSICVSLVVLLCVAVSIMAYAQSTVNLKINTSNEKVNRGENFTVSVDISNVQAGVLGIEIPLVYDSNTLEYVSSSIGTAVNLDLKDIKKIGSTVKLSATGTKTLASDGTIMEVTFKVKANAVAGKTQLSIPNCAIAGNIVDGKPLKLSYSCNPLDIDVQIPIESVSLDRTNGKLEKGENQTLICTKNPADTTSTSAVDWTSSNTSVATVKDGVVTAVGGGYTDITATVDGKSAKYELMVPSAMTSIELSQTKINMTMGETEKIDVSFFPSDTTDEKQVKWSSSDTSVVTVKDGEVYAIKDGTATITATVGKFTKTCLMTIKDIPLTDIEINSDKTEISVAEQIQMSITYVPENTSDDKDVIWESSDLNIATVQDGLVTGLSNGEVEISATVGEFKKTFSLSVSDIAITEIKPSISKVNLIVGESETVSLTYIPENTTELKQSVWTSSDSKVVKVNLGKITALKEGSAVVTASVNGITTDIEVVIKAKEVIATPAPTPTPEETPTDYTLIIVIVIVLILAIACVLFIYFKKSKEKTNNEEK